MNTQVIELKECYSTPRVERINLEQPPKHLLVSVSFEAGIEDWEEGEEL